MVTPRVKDPDAFSRTQIPESVMEFFVYLPGGDFRTFEQRKMRECGEFIRDAPKPCKVERAVYHKGTGIRCTLGRRTRRERLVFEQPVRSIWIVPELNTSRSEQIQDAKELVEDGMPVSMVAKIYRTDLTALRDHRHSVGIMFKNKSELRFQP